MFRKYPSSLFFLCVCVAGASAILVLAKGLRAFPRYTVEQRVEQFGKVARARWKPFFTRAGVSYPPKSVSLLGLKDEKVLEVYASGVGDELRFIRSIPVCAASGRQGPKLREGDFQVPEGIYRVSFLNANSRFHLSLRVNYPNAFDRQKAKEEGRSNLGGDIMIHGSCVSIGCLAVEKEPVEDLFILAADVGIQNTEVVLAPYDFRKADPPRTTPESLTSWTGELYQRVNNRMRQLPQGTP